MKNKMFRYATIMALGTALISGTNTFLAKIAVKAVKDPIAYTTLKNGIVAVLLVSIILFLKKWPEIKSLTRGQWGKLFAIGVIGGAIPFALFFTGLKQTPAINAAMIHKTLFLWVLILAIPILKERLQTWQWVGVGLIFVANLFLGGFKGFQYNTGELMIFVATLFWAVENIIAKIVLRELSSVMVATARMLFGSIILLSVVIWQGKFSFLSSGFSVEQWSWTFLTAVLLLGYVLTWYTALKYAPATYVATLIVPAILVTNILSAVFITHSFLPNKIISTGLYLLGMGMVIFFSDKFTSKANMAHGATISS